MWNTAEGVREEGKRSYEGLRLRLSVNYGGFHASPMIRQSVGRAYRGLTISTS